MKDLGLGMVVKAANHRIQERRFPSWEGEAPAEPQQSHNGIADTDPQVAYDRRLDRRCRVRPAYKTCVGERPLHTCHASPTDGHIGFRLGRSLALPVYIFVHVRVASVRHRRVSVSQSRTVM